MKLVEGQQLAQGKYILAQLLGEGSQGQVWKAWQQSHQGFTKKVVLKFRRPDLALTDEQTQRENERRRLFLNEARLAAKLHHPNVVEIYDLGQEGEADYIAMENIEGGDLEMLLERYQERHQRPLPWILVSQMAMQICNGLHYAHTQTDEHGNPLHLIHRDLKPANILLTTNGTVKVIDFGIAKATSNLGKTDTGIVRGTPYYMAPEQIRAKTLDSRVDLFSLGVILYELCSGHKPFVGHTPDQILVAIVTTEPPPFQAYGIALPDELDTLIFRLLQKQPEQRPNSAQETRLLLKQVLQSHKIYPDQDRLVQLYAELSTQEKAPSPSTLQFMSSMIRQVEGTPDPQSAPPSTQPYGLSSPNGTDTFDDLPKSTSPASSTVNPSATAPADEQGQTELMLDLSHIPLPPNKRVDPNAPTAFLPSPGRSQRPPINPLEETELLWRAQESPALKSEPAHENKPKMPPNRVLVVMVVLVVLGVLLLLVGGMFLYSG